MSLPDVSFADAVAVAKHLGTQPMTEAVLQMDVDELRALVGRLAALLAERTDLDALADLVRRAEAAR